MTVITPKREVRDAVSGKLVCSYLGGEVPRRGEPFTVVTYDATGRSVKTDYEVIAVLWNVTCYGHDSPPPEDQWEQYHPHNAGDAINVPLVTIKVSGREIL